MIAQNEDYYFHHLTQADGLAQTNNNVVFKDSRGFVWISSLNGLHRYDGRQVKVYKHRVDDPYSLPDNYIQSRIIEDENRDLWFSTYEALVRYDRKQDRFVSFRDSTGGKARIGYHLEFSTINEDFGVVVEGTDFQLFHPKSETWTHRLSFPHTMYLVLPVMDQNGHLSGIISGNYDRPGIHFYDFNLPLGSNHQVRFDGKNGEPSLRLNDGVWLGDTLLIAAKEGFMVYPKNGENWQFSLSADGSPNKVSLLKNGEIIASLNGSGWLKLNRRDLSYGKNYLKDPSNPLSLNSNTTYGVWEDGDGGLWTGTTGIGVDFTFPQKVKFDVLDIGKTFGVTGRPIGVNAIAEDEKGNIWCSTRGSGLFVLSPDLQPLYHFSSKNKKAYTIATNDIPYLFFDHQGRCWATTFTGLFMRPPDGKSFTSISPNGFLYGLELKGRKELLFTTLDGGISLLKKSNNGFQFEKIAHLDTTSAYTHLYQNWKGQLLANKNLQSILVLDIDRDFAILDEWDVKGDVHCYFEEPDSDTIWIGTKNGLTCLDQKDPDSSYTFTEDDGLPDQEIYAITGDDSTLWLTTNRGMVRFYKKEKRFHTFDLYDGMQGLEYNSHGFMRRGNGDIWFAGQRGINFFHPNAVHPLANPPQVQLTGIWVNDERKQAFDCAKTGAKNVSEVEKLIFRPEERKFRFEFAALEYSNPASNTFRYQLKGFDEGWSPWTKENFAIYNKLPPGDYTLLVTAANADGYPAEKWKELDFTIEKPFWQKCWFLLLAALVLLGLGYAVYRYRLAQHLRYERLRNQISNDLHDDIGATLSNLSILTTLIRQKLPADNEALPLLQRIEEEVSASAESLDDIIWSINPKNDPLDRVLARMRRFASEVFEAKGIEGNILFPKEAKHLRLDMAKRRQFYLIFKEAVNNLAKYAECKTAEIIVSYQNGKLNLTIRDDGKGFDLEERKDAGNGLSTMRQRAADLQGTIRIQSKTGFGTSVNMVFPITEISD